MVTHFVTISAITGIAVSSGGMVSYNPKTGHAMPIEESNIRLVAKICFTLLLIAGLSLA